MARPPPLPHGSRQVAVDTSKVDTKTNRGQRAAVNLESLGRATTNQSTPGPGWPFAKASPSPPHSAPTPPHSNLCTDNELNFKTTATIATTTATATAIVSPHLALQQQQQLQSSPPWNFTEPGRPWTLELHPHRPRHQQRAQL